MIFGGAACGTLLSPAAAVVNGHKITIDEIQTAVDRFAASQQFAQLVNGGSDADDVRHQFEQTYLSSIIRLQVLEPQAKKLGVSVSNQEIVDQLDSAKQQYGGSFDKVLAQIGLTRDQLYDFVFARLLEAKLKKKITAPAKPTEAELKQFYESHLDDYTQTRASHILVKDKTLAQQIADRLHAAPAKEVPSLFATLAKRYSTDKTTAKKGGDVGFFSPGQFPEPFENAAVALHPGQVSDPVKSSFGYHVIEVTDRKVEPFSQVRADIESLIGGPAEEAAWQSWVLDAYVAADVKVNPRYGEFDPTTQQIVNSSTANVPGTVPLEPSPPESPFTGLTPAPSAT